MLIRHVIVEQQDFVRYEDVMHADLIDELKKQRLFLTERKKEPKYSLGCNDRTVPRNASVLKAAIISA